MHPTGFHQSGVSIILFLIFITYRHHNVVCRTKVGQKLRSGRRLLQRHVTCLLLFFRISTRSFARQLTLQLTPPSSCLRNWSDWLQNYILLSRLSVRHLVDWTLGDRLLCLWQWPLRWCAQIEEIKWNMGAVISATAIGFYAPPGLSSESLPLKLRA